MAKSAVEYIIRPAPYMPCILGLLFVLYKFVLVGIIQIMADDNFDASFSMVPMQANMCYNVCSLHKFTQHWVFFWYNATYFWTFFFAVDVYNAKHGGKWKLCCSHFFTWTFCFVYITGSMCSLWACPPYFEWVSARVQLLVLHIISLLM